MENKILIDNSEFRLDTSDEYIGELTVWKKTTKIFLNIQDNKEDVSHVVIEKINWLNDNKDKIIDIFMEENGHYVDVINEMIESGDFKADKRISEKEFVRSLFVNNVTIYVKGSETDFCLDLEAEPDYLLGHLAYMEIDSEYEVEFCGMNG
ncbi:hypothetical protein [Fusobacterium necrophorum]|uniref:DUF2262 domain-containing protein n=2 Tax=Fusobacterium necrophorum TaxID=859 RepID=A0AB73C637_9FUSO|nr:hypothetical protein [Fusobacterium necrophorum]AVQ21138.1 hypothetical protein C4N15_05580 [Fusobacterium necrophorum subsp. funduliforme]KDE61213.1 hypothetical protein FUSO4_12205 [Fusobacterium necrophorum DJ-1]KDE73770.1 hypothetical protein FUSO8_00310 [Fusobacterium necrophorum DJ-2]KYM44496.1 hypothetical protein A2U08_02180 [Fusobacterium necrophorum subsp. funduliforme]KYM45040.1 hypothetical protein A2U15_05595 [Fusobacterium necrophorum subsp. funduliforme]